MNRPRREKRPREEPCAAVAAAAGTHKKRPVYSHFPSVCRVHRPPPLPQTEFPLPLVTMVDYYAILEVGREASQAEVKKA